MAGRGSQAICICTKMPRTSFWVKHRDSMWACIVVLWGMVRKQTLTNVSTLLPLMVKSPSSMTSLSPLLLFIFPVFFFFKLLFPTCQVRVVRFYVSCPPPSSLLLLLVLLLAGPHRSQWASPDLICQLLIAPDRCRPPRASTGESLIMPERMSEDMPDRMSEDMTGRMSEDMTDRMPEDMPDRMSEDLPDRMSEDMPDGMPDRYARKNVRRSARRYDRQNARRYAR